MKGWLEKKEARKSKINTITLAPTTQTMAHDVEPVVVEVEDPPEDTGAACHVPGVHILLNFSRNNAFVCRP